MAQGTRRRNDSGIRISMSCLADFITSYGRSAESRLRPFKILSNRRLEYRIGGIVITAQPDLWAEERGTQVLLRIGIAKHNTSYVDMLLALLRKAAVSSGYKIRAKNIVYLNVANGKEMICSGPLTRFNRTFGAATKEIASAWPTITSPSTPTGGPSEARA
jgi:hypothetical protein